MSRSTPLEYHSSTDFRVLENTRVVFKKSLNNTWNYLQTFMSLVVNYALKMYLILDEQVVKVLAIVNNFTNSLFLY